MLDRSVSAAVAAVVAAVSSIVVKRSLGGAIAAPTAPRIEDIQRPLEKVAFGSCNDQSFPQPLWKNIVAHEPDLWVWMGDNVRCALAWDK